MMAQLNTYEVSSQCWAKQKPGILCRNTQHRKLTLPGIMCMFYHKGTRCAICTSVQPPLFIIHMCLYSIATFWPSTMEVPLQDASGSGWTSTSHVAAPRRVSGVCFVAHYGEDMWLRRRWLLRRCVAGRLVTLLKETLDLRTHWHRLCGRRWCTAT